MVTTAQFVFPAAEVALADALNQLSDVRVTLEQSVERCDGDCSCLWVTDTTESELRDALGGDSSVQGIQIVDEQEGEWLVSVDFHPTFHLVKSILIAEEGVIADVVGRDGSWVVTCRYSDHASLGEVRTLLDDRGFNYEVRRIRNGSEMTPNGIDLSSDQYEALKHAYQQGYFEVPREKTLAELADELDISHQALSERIRRAMKEYFDSEFPQVDPDASEVKPTAQ